MYKETLVLDYCHLRITSKYHFSLCSVDGVKYQRITAVPFLRRGVPDRSTVYSIAKYVPAVDVPQLSQC